MKLATLSGPDGETEQRRGLGVAFCLEGGERSRVPLDRLGTFALYGVELHSANYAVLLGGDT